MLSIGEFQPYQGSFVVEDVLTVVVVDNVVAVEVCCVVVDNSVLLTSN